MKRYHDFNHKARLSDIISADEFLNHNELYNSVHHTKNKQDHIISKYSSGIYIILDRDKQPIYVGKSLHLRSRILNHLKEPTFYNSSLEFYLKEVNKFLETSFFMFYETSPSYLDVFEVLFIQEYKPKYNLEYLHGKKVSDLTNLQTYYSKLENILN
mgnify:CR=1 FL=1